MARTAAQRQADFRKLHGNKFKRLDVLLPIDVFNELHGNALEQGITKAAYINSLLRDNGKTSITDVLVRFLPNGINNTNDMRSALSNGYRRDKKITGTLKPNDSQGLIEYLESLSAKQVGNLIQIKKDEIRTKAKEKRLSRKIKK